MTTEFTEIGTRIRLEVREANGTVKCCRADKPTA